MVSFTKNGCNFGQPKFGFCGIFLGGISQKVMTVSRGIEFTYLVHFALKFITPFEGISNNFLLLNRNFMTHTILSLLQRRMVSFVNHMWIFWPSGFSNSYCLGIGFSKFVTIFLSYLLSPTGFVIDAIACAPVIISMFLEIDDPMHHATKFRYLYLLKIVRLVWLANICMH